MKYIFCGVAAGFFFLAAATPAYAYGVDTHAALSVETIRLYNDHAMTPLPADLHDFFIDGSRREDDPPRWMNHFYDPVNERGLVSGVYGHGLASPLWAISDDEQLRLKYDPFIASILSFGQQRKIQGFLSASNYTWNEALRYWLNGDREMAMFTLGHVVHLMQDASVPDHTRNDPHPPFEGGSPYEDWTKQFTPETIGLDIENMTPYSADMLGESFRVLAQYSNENFYSAHSIGVWSGYDSPEPDDFELIDGYYYAIEIDGEDRIKLYKQNTGNSLMSPQFNSVKFDSPEIMQGYWDRLSVKAVEHGAGVIDLFFSEVERLENDPSFSRTQQPSKMGVLARRTGDAIRGAFSAVAGLFDSLTGVAALSLEDEHTNSVSGGEILGRGKIYDRSASVGYDRGDDAVTEFSAQNPEDADQEMGVNFVETGNEVIRVSGDRDGAVISQKSGLPETQEDDQDAGSISAEDAFGLTLLAEIPVTGNEAGEDSPAEKEESVIAAAPTFSECSFITSQKPAYEPPVVINEVAWMGTHNSATDEWIEIMNRGGEPVDIYGWQLIDQAEQIHVIFDGETELTPAEPFYLLERTDDDAVPNVPADQIYTGSLSNKDEGLRLFDAQCHLIDEVLALPSWPAGEGKERLTMERFRQNHLWHTYYAEPDEDGAILGTPRALNSMPPAAGSGGASAARIASAIPVPTQTATPTPTPTPTQAQTPTPTPTPTQSVSAETSSGITTSQADSSDASAHIVISEIYSDRSGANQDFVELYNPTDNDVGLEGWSLQVLSGSADTFDSVKKKNFESGNIIRAHEYFLVGLDGYPEVAGELPAADMLWRSGSLTNSGASVFAVQHTVALSDDKDAAIVDLVGYGAGEGLHPSEGEPVVYDGDGSIERKAFRDGMCIDPTNNPTAGNGCDTDSNAADLILRSSAEPQNSGAPAEPRQRPAAVTDLSSVFDPVGLEVQLSWEPSGDAVAYAIYTVNSPETLIGTTRETTYRFPVHEVGKRYTFRVAAVDDANAESEKEEVQITPLIIEEGYVYPIEDEGGEARYVVELVLPELSSLPDPHQLGAFAGLRMRLNNDGGGPGLLHLNSEWEGEAGESDLFFAQPQCGRGGGRVDFSNQQRATVVLPRESRWCMGSGGGSTLGAMAYPYGYLEDSRLVLPIAQEGLVLAQEDYVSISYYARIPSAGSPNLAPVAIDAQQFPVLSVSPPTQAPTAPMPVEATVDDAYVLQILHGDSTDTDSVDGELRYQYAVHRSDVEKYDWVEGIGAMVLEPAEAYTIAVRALDESGNYSESVEIEYTTPRLPTPWGIENMRWGYINEQDPDNIYVGFDVPKWPLVTGGDNRWPASGALSAMIFYLNEMDPVLQEFGAKYTHSLSIGEGNDRLQLGYSTCAKRDADVSALVMRAAETCEGRGDSIHWDEIIMPTELEMGSLMVRVSGLRESERDIANLNSDDFITISFHSAYNGGRPRGTFSRGDLDRNKYYFTARTGEDFSDEDEEKEGVDTPDREGVLSSSSTSELGE